MAKFIKQLGDYEIHDPIGNPQESRVFVGRDVAADAPVAIKALPLDFFRAEREFEQFKELTAKLTQLKHPHILVPRKVIGKYTEAFLIEDLIDGPNLRGYVERTVPDVNAVTIMAVNLMNALQFLHSKKLLHRNVKAANILVPDPKRVMLCDMFYSPLFVRWRKERGFPSVEAVRYVSPEECQEKKLLPESDIYSLGVCLFYAYTRVLPIRGTSAEELQTKHVKMHIRERPDIINPAIPKFIADMLMQMLNKAPKKRYAQLGELILDLRRLTSDQPGRRPTSRI